LFVAAAGRTTTAPHTARRPAARQGSDRSVEPASLFSQLPNNLINVHALQDCRFYEADSRNSNKRWLNWAQQSSTKKAALLSGG
jgi:hypothetical protein